MTLSPAKKQLGLSLVELLISMAILGILLAMLSAFLISNQRVTTQQITAATINNDLRLAFLRMSDVIAQAHYIFPPDQKVFINGTEYTTGAQTLAVLIPSGTTYCTIPENYCGFAFTIEDRAGFVNDLGSDGGTSGFTLVETSVRDIRWDKDELPTTVANIHTWVNATRFPIVDSVAAAGSDLASFTRLQPSKDTSYDNGFKVGSVTPAEYNKYLAASVNSLVRLERTANGKTLSLERENFVFSRAIPRGDDRNNNP